MVSDDWPISRQQRHDCQFRSGDLLLIPERFITRHEHVESGIFRRLQQLAILHSVPAHERNRRNLMIRQVLSASAAHFRPEEPSRLKLGLACEGNQLRDFIRREEG
jgi:hypothetical protein